MLKRPDRSTVLAAVERRLVERVAGSSAHVHWLDASREKEACVMIAKAIEADLDARSVR